MKKRNRHRRNLWIRCIVFLSLFCIIATSVSENSLFAEESIINVIDSSTNNQLPDTDLMSLSVDDPDSATGGTEVSSTPDDATDETIIDGTNENTEGEIETTGNTETTENTEDLEDSVTEGYSAMMSNSVMPMEETTETEDTDEFDAYDGISTVVADDGSTSTYGDYQLVLPSSNDDITFDVTLNIHREYYQSTVAYSPSGNEAYKITIIDADGTSSNTFTVQSDSGEIVISNGWVNFYAYYPGAVGDPGVFSLQILGLSSGSTVLVEDVQVEHYIPTSWGYAYGSYDNTLIEASILTSSPSSQASVTGDNPVALTAGATTTSTASLIAAEDADSIITEDFEYFGGIYSIIYMLDHYNVVSLDDIESTHIVGPILAVDTASRTTLTPSSEETDGVLVASDYSRGVFSYVGRLTSQTGVSSSSSFIMNYDFDRTEVGDSFTPPYFYTTYDIYGMQYIYTVSDTEYIQLADDSDYLSPNDYGAQHTYQNNTFLNIEALTKALEDGSQEILENGTIESVEIPYSERYYYVAGTVYYGATLNADGTYDFTGSNVITDRIGSYGLEINIGESWMIIESEGLNEINLITDDGLTFFETSYLQATTINFVESEINPIYIDNDGDGDLEVHSRFPDIYFNDSYLAAESLANGEYSELGNKIIWNMPNLVTTDNDNRLITYGSGQNIPGHLIAPQAEFWNYDDTASSWEGGNINGTSIFKSFYSGNAEMHMWAYDGLAEQGVVYSVSVTKTVDGDTPTRTYEFELDVDDTVSYTDTDGDGLPDGLMNNVFPMYASTSTDNLSEATFTQLAFNAAGTYYFTVKEVIPTGTPTDNVIYDLSEYQVAITVSMETVDETNVYSIDSVTYTQTVDRYGESITNQVATSNSIVFNNLLTHEDTVSLTLYKQSTTGALLPGAVFYLSEMTSATNTARPSGGYLESSTSGTDGTVVFSDLSVDTYYMLTETVAPAGHIVETGYWILYIGENGYLQSSTAVGGAAEIINNIVINEAEDYAALDLTLTKENQLGQALEAVSFSVRRVTLYNGIPEVVANGYNQIVTSDASGSFTLYGLEADHIYMIVEDDATTPEDHYVHDGYWLVYVTGNELHPSQDLTYTIVEYDSDHNVVSTITDATLVNEKMDYMLPNTGGMGTKGTNIFYLIGIMFMAFAIINYILLCKRKN